MCGVSDFWRGCLIFQGGLIFWGEWLIQIFLNSNFARLYTEKT